LLTKQGNVIPFPWFFGAEFLALNPPQVHRYAPWGFLPALSVVKGDFRNHAVK